MRIGIIGVGVMGHGMAANLLAHGHEVITICHRNRGPIDDLVARGGRQAACLDELAQTSEAIILCLPNAAIVADTVETLTASLRPGQLVIDTSTSKPQVSEKIAGDLVGAGVDFIEAPVMGGAAQARDGSLGAMVGASAEALAKATPVLNSFCARICHFGPPGAGGRAKLISNYLVFAMVSAIAESYNLARERGIDWAKLYDVMLCGANNSEALRRMVGNALDGNFDGYQFTLAGAHKDMRYFLDMIESDGEASALAKAVMDVYEHTLEQGLGGHNVSRLIDPALADKG